MKTKKSKISCLRCSKSFKKKYELRSHQKLCKHDYKCKSCESTYKRIDHFKAHIKVHEKSPENNSKTLECPKCLQTFASEGDLHLHKKTCKAQYTCKACGKHFKRSDFYNNHLESHKSTSTPKKCHLCPESFQSQAAYVSHLVDAHNLTQESLVAEERLTCAICLQKFDAEPVLHLHRKSCKHEFNCDICGKTYSRIDHFEEHVKSHNSTSPGRHACKLCPDDFHSMQAYLAHVDSVHSTKKFSSKDEKPTCVRCSLSVASNDELMLHKKTCKEPLIYECKPCSKTYRRIDYYELHLKQHENIEIAADSKLEACKFCPKILQNKEQYLVHIETVHKNEKSSSYICSTCGKQYRTTTDLKQHNKSQCGTIKIFKCKLCAKEYASAGALFNHMLRHKGEQNFMCRFCAKKFFTNGQLKAHERIHTQDKAFVCQVCNKGFCHRTSLITHTSLHTGIKPYPCENCGSAFSCIGNLIKHRKSHADTCGLLPMTMHKVANALTRQKVTINSPTPAKCSRLTKKEQMMLDEVENLKVELEKKPDLGPKFKEEHSGIVQIENNEKTDLAYSFLQLKILEDNPKLEETKTDIQFPIVEVKETNDSNDKEILFDIPTINDTINQCNNVEESDKIKNEDIDFFDNENDDMPPDVETRFSDSDSEDDLPLKTLIDKVKSEGTERPKEEIKTAELKTKSRRRKNKSFEQKLKKFLADLGFNKKGSAACIHCNKRYTNGRWLYRHVNQHENSPTLSQLAKPSLYKCNHCVNVFTSKEDRHYHLQSAHADILTCLDCKKTYNNATSLNYHRKVVHEGMKRHPHTYICPKCGEAFKQRQYFQAHEAQNCKRGTLYHCKVCNNYFANKYVLKTHMLTHEPESEKKFLCNFCPRRFRSNGQLKVHERSHTGIKPFACLYCPKAFSYPESLVTHTSIHTGFKKYVCEGCGTRFSCVGNLIKHRKTHANECGDYQYKNEAFKFKRMQLALQH